MNNTNRLGTKNITELLLEFSIPAIIGMIVNACYNIVSRIYIGNHPDLGVTGIAAITVVFPIMLIFFSVACLSGIGGATLYSIKLGEQKLDDAKAVLGNATLLMIVTGAAIMIPFMIWLKPALIFFGATNTILPPAIDYVTIIVFGNVFQSISFGLNCFVRSDGKPKIAMTTMLLGAIFNIVTAPILIYVFGWGIKGAAIAVVGGQLVTMLWVLKHFLGTNCNVRLSLQSMRPRKDVIGTIAKMGIPAFSLQFVNSFQMLVLNKVLLFYGGELAISTMGVVMSLQTIMIMPIVGVAQGSQPIIGYNFGAKLYARVRETLKQASIGATVIVTIGCVVMWIMPERLLLMFNNDPDLIKLGTYAMHVCFFFLPLVGFQIVSSVYFQSIGKVKAATILSLARQLLIFIPAVIILPRLYSLNGIFYALPLSDLITFFLTVIWVYLDLKHLGKPPQNAPRRTNGISAEHIAAAMRKLSRSAR